MDKSIRALERLARRGDREAELALLNARVRSGFISRPALRVAALMGSREARTLLPDEGNWPTGDDPLCGLERSYIQLTDLVRQCVRDQIWLAMPLFDRVFPGDLRLRNFVEMSNSNVVESVYVLGGEGALADARMRVHRASGTEHSDGQPALCSESEARAAARIAEAADFIYQLDVGRAVEALIQARVQGALAENEDADVDAARFNAAEDVRCAIIAGALQCGDQIHSEVAEDYIAEVQWNLEGDDAISGLIAETNTVGWSVDQWEAYDAAIVAGDDQSAAYLEVRARVELSGEHAEDKPATATSITADVAFRASWTPQGWRWSDYEVLSASLDEDGLYEDEENAPEPPDDEGEEDE